MMTYPFNPSFGFVDHLGNPNDYVFGTVNDSPLEFSLPKPRQDDTDDQSSQSPSETHERRRDRREKDRRSMENQREDADGGPPGGMVNGGNLPNLWAGMMGGYPLVGMNMIMDPSGMMPTLMPSMMVQGDPNAGSSMLPPPPNHQEPPNILLPPVTTAKEIIHCKSCTLFPPNPNAPPPTTRERPPGCRTVFVGGLPENMTDEIIMEVFERCGEITTLRLSKKTFCHIRFVFENSVDAAIFLSGYRIRIGSNSDPPNTGRLHVDYAQARDDQYEWECKQRQVQREQRHRVRMEEERLRPPSPPPVVHYTDHEATAVSEKIKQDDTFTKAVQVVITWLERGDCSKRNANTFYSMIQSTNSHIRRLLGEKAQYEDELQKAKEILKGRMQGILLQFSQIERLFVAACHKKVWDHFTKAQRKNIESWKRQSLEIKNVHADCDTQRDDDDEMDMSDSDDQLQQLQVQMQAQTAGVRKRFRADDVAAAGGSGMSNGGGAPDAAQQQQQQQQLQQQLRDENNVIRCQMEAYKNEVEVIRVDMQSELDDRDEQLKLLQQTLQNLQQQLIDSKRKQAEDNVRLKELQVKVKAQNDQTQIVCIGEHDVVSDRCDSANSSGINSGDIGAVDSVSSASIPSAAPTMTDNEAKLIGIISTFLNVHPFGAGLDYIWSYVTKMESSIRPSDLELLMSKFPAVFGQKVVGIGANIERRWLFCAFNKNSNGS